MTPTIATADDIDPIVTLVNGAYRGEAAARGWTHEGGLLDGQRTDAGSLREAVAAGAVLLILRRDGEAAPLACVSVEPKDAAGTWYLGLLTVAPDAQAGGVGRAMLEAAERHVRARGARRVEMTVIHLRESLIAWYERRGYARTGATAPFPYGDDRFGVPRRADLHFIVLEKDL